MVPIQRQTPRQTPTQRTTGRTVTANAIVPIVRQPSGQPAVPFNAGGLFFRLPFLGSGQKGGIGRPQKRTSKRFLFSGLDPEFPGVVQRTGVDDLSGFTSRVFNLGERRLRKARKEAPIIDIFGDTSINLNLGNGTTKKVKRKGSKKSNPFGNTAVKLNL